MAKFFHNTLRIPHIQNAAERVRVLRFFIKAFALGFLLIQSSVIAICLTIRFRLGFPAQCSGLPEKVYAAVYTLLAIALSMWLLVLFSYVGVDALRRSGQTKWVGVAYLVLNILQFFVILVSRFHRAGYSSTSLLVSHAHIFTGGCLESVQAADFCCGFKNYTEWLEVKRESENAVGIILNGEERISNASFSETIESSRNYHSGESVFPLTCLCSDKFSARCLEVRYVFVPSTGFTSSVPFGMDLSVRRENRSAQNLSSWSSTESNINDSFTYDTTTSLTTETNTNIARNTVTVRGSDVTERDSIQRDTISNQTYSSTATHSAIVRAQACIDPLLSRFKTIDISTAATAVVSASISLVVFFVGYVLTHNLEGSVTVSDVYLPSADVQGHDSFLASREGDHSVPNSRHTRPSSGRAPSYDLSHFVVATKQIAQVPDVDLSIDSNDISKSKSSLKDTQDSTTAGVVENRSASASSAHDPQFNVVFLNFRIKLH